LATSAKYVGLTAISHDFMSNTQNKGSNMAPAKKTKAQLLKMLKAKGIPTKPSMKKDELIALLESADAPTPAPAPSKAASEQVEVPKTESQETTGLKHTGEKTGSKLRNLLVVGVFVAIAVIAWILLS